MKIDLKILSIFVCFEFVTAPLFAQNNAESLRFTKQAVYEARVEKIARVFDSNAVVVLDLKVQPQKVDLPLTPFSTNLNLDNGEQKSEVIVRIVTTDAKLPQVAEAFIKEALSPLSKDIKIVYQNLDPSKANESSKAAESNTISSQFDRFL